MPNGDILLRELCRAFNKLGDASRVVAVANALRAGLI